MWLRLILESSNQEVPLIADGMRYIRSRALFFRMGHKCSYILPNSFPDYIPYLILLSSSEV